VRRARLPRQTGPLGRSGQLEALGTRNLQDASWQEITFFLDMKGQICHYMIIKRVPNHENGGLARMMILYIAHIFRRKSMARIAVFKRRRPYRQKKSPEGSAVDPEAGPFSKPAEASWADLGEKLRDTSNHVGTRLESSGPVGTRAVEVAPSRETNRATAMVVQPTDNDFFQNFVHNCAEVQTSAKKDSTNAWETLPYEHAALEHSAIECGCGQARTDGVESLRPMLRRNFFGTIHNMLPKHLQRRVRERFAWHDGREPDTSDRIVGLVDYTQIKSTRYRNLIVENELNSGTRLGGGLLALC